MKSILVAALALAGFVAALVTAGCSGQLDSPDSLLAAALNLAPADVSRVLDFVNYPGTDKALLDNAVGLDERAAQNIITLHRDGADGIVPSADDKLFTTLAELDAIPYVTDTALQKLAAYSLSHPAPAGQTVETVSFAGWQVEAVVYGVNHGAQSDLDPLLDARSVTAILAQRPFATLSAIAAVPYVGASALSKLKAHAAIFWAQLRGTAGLAGTFDGVTFDEASAKIALEIANQATLSQMSSNGVPAAPAAAVVGNRPYTNLAQVAAVGGVGPATMKGLLAYAQSGLWNAPPSACLTSFESTVGPLLPQLLFLSESDRPFDLQTWPGKGTTTLTPESFFALLHEPANWSFLTRDPNDYYADLEPSGSGSDPNAAAQVQTAFGTLTNVIYISVHQPKGSLNQAEVHVYLVGRTSCGDIVGIHAISIET
jgi:DNA uptake protein ComE-like DNA-binding protein